MRKCKECGTKYEPTQSFQSWCSPECGVKIARKRQEKAAEAKRKAFNRETRKRKEANKSRSEWISETQTVFNRFIRIRDKDEPCISCGKYDWEIEDKFVGGKWDCGHFLSRGAYPELRFEELNANKQCKSCNAGSGKFSHKGRTVSQEYEERLIKKIGQDKVDWLKGPHKPKRYTIDELKELKAYYRKKCKEMENG